MYSSVWRTATKNALPSRHAFALLAWLAIPLAVACLSNSALLQAAENQAQHSKPFNRKPSGVIPVPIEDTPPLVMPFNSPESVPPPFADQFTIDRATNLVIVGSTNGVEMSQHAYLDVLLHRAYPNQEIHMRNMAWQADTVYFQRRPRYFYGTAEHRHGDLDLRQRITPDMIFIWMGQTESLDGPDRLDEFREKYQEIVQLMKTYTGRVVLLTPVPFENPFDLPFDPQARNASLASYVETIKQIGAEESLLVVDLFEPLLAEARENAWTHDGLHLSAQGQWEVARQIATQLGFADAVAEIETEWPSGQLAPAAAEQAREIAQYRNLLWFRYWRPTNWAFLYGNRQQHESGHSHEQRNVRWFPSEVESTLTVLETAEKKLHDAIRSYDPSVDP